MIFDFLAAKGIQRTVNKNAHLQHFLSPSERVEQTLFTGVIVDSFAYLHMYYVQSDFNAMVYASALSPTGLSPAGYRQHSMYPPGTRVLCYRPPLATQIYIVGALNAPIGNGKINLPDWVHQNSGCSYLDEVVHNFLATVGPEGAMRNFNAHRPVDSFPGEQGWFNLLGMGLHLGHTALFMRASEIAGLWMFYLDNMVRLAAHNWQHWTAASEWHAGNDEGELYDLVRVSPFYKESLGLGPAGSELTRSIDAEWKKGQTDCKYEPKEPDQTGIYRLHQFRGYLGDGGQKTIVSCPPPDLELETLSADTAHIGLSEVTHHPNGLLSFRSAKGIILERYPLIPVPKKKREPADPEGDSREKGNYRFAGQSPEDAPEHDKSELRLQEPTDPLARTAQLYDLHAWLFNSYAQSTFARHEKDWHLPQEQDYAEKSKLQSAVDPGLYPSMKLRYRKDTPKSVKLRIDSRKGHEHEYYQSRSVRALLDDGTIHDEDGYGSFITLSGGNIIISCPGDLEFRTGRNTVIWSGRDFVAKAGNCSELSAAKGDVRIKAERNLHMLGGNSGKGGVLIESRSETSDQQFTGQGTDVTSAGILLISKNSQIAAYGHDLYLRSLDTGSITIDADQGLGDVHLFANRRLETVLTDVETAFGVTADAQEQALTVERHSVDRVVFGQASEVLFKAGQLMIPSGSMRMAGTAFIQGGVVWQGLPASMGGPWTSADFNEVNQGTLRLKNALVQGRKDVQKAREELYENNAPGNQDRIESIGFSCRTDQQYGVTEFVVYEGRWQHELEEGVVFQEPVVLSPTQARTRPWPGHDTLQDSQVLRRYEPKFWNSAAGYNRARPYDDPEAAAFINESLDSGYKVTIQD